MPVRHRTGTVTGMPTLKLRRPSPALLLAVAALILALGGTATAAVVITSGQIKDGTIRARDLDPKLRKQLASRAVPGLVGPAGPAGPAGPRGDAGTAGAKGAAGDPGKDAFLDTAVVGGASQRDISSTTFTDVIGATTTVTVPAGRTATVVAELSAESACTGSAGDQCLVQILLDGQEMWPSHNGLATFDSVDDGGGRESHAIVRSAEGVAAGTHTVTVQGAVYKSGATTPDLTLDEISLVVRAS
jgi:hypothetical protein